MSWGWRVAFWLSAVIDLVHLLRYGDHTELSADDGDDAGRPQPSIVAILERSRVRE